jgi:hypothetical protein
MSGDPAASGSGSPCDSERRTTRLATREAARAAEPDPEADAAGRGPDPARAPPPALGDPGDDDPPATPGRERTRRDGEAGTDDDDNGEPAPVSDDRGRGPPGSLGGDPADGPRGASSPDDTVRALGAGATRAGARTSGGRAESDGLENRVRDAPPADSGSSSSAAPSAALAGAHNTGGSGSSVTLAGARTLGGDGPDVTLAGARNPGSSGSSVTLAGARTLGGDGPDVTLAGARNPGGSGSSVTLAGARTLGGDGPDVTLAGARNPGSSGSSVTLAGARTIGGDGSSVALAGARTSRALAGADAPTEVPDYIPRRPGGSEEYNAAVTAANAAYHETDGLLSHLAAARMLRGLIADLNAQFPSRQATQVPTKRPRVGGVAAGDEANTVKSLLEVVRTVSGETHLVPDTSYESTIDELLSTATRLFMDGVDPQDQAACDEAADHGRELLGPLVARLFAKAADSLDVSRLWTAAIESTRTSRARWDEFLRTLALKMNQEGITTRAVFALDLCVQGSDGVTSYRWKFIRLCRDAHVAPETKGHRFRLGLRAAVAAEVQTRLRHDNPSIDEIVAAAQAGELEAAHRALIQGAARRAPGADRGAGASTSPTTEAPKDKNRKRPLSESTSRCHSCGVPGHVAAECRTGVCTRCRIPGHRIRECRMPPPPAAATVPNPGPAPGNGDRRDGGGGGDGNAPNGPRPSGPGGRQPYTRTDGTQRHGDDKRGGTGHYGHRRDHHVRPADGTAPSADAVATINAMMEVNDDVCEMDSLDDLTRAAIADYDAAMAIRAADAPPLFGPTSPATVAAMSAATPEHARADKDGAPGSGIIGALVSAHDPGHAPGNLAEHGPPMVAMGVLFDTGSSRTIIKRSAHRGTGAVTAPPSGVISILMPSGATAPVLGTARYRLHQPHGDGYIDIDALVVELDARSADLIVGRDHLHEASVRWIHDPGGSRRHAASATKTSKPRPRGPAGPSGHGTSATRAPLPPLPRDERPDAEPTTRRGPWVRRAAIAAVAVCAVADHRHDHGIRSPIDFGAPESWTDVGVPRGAYAIGGGTVPMRLFPVGDDRNDPDPKEQELLVGTAALDEYPLDVQEFLPALLDEIRLNSLIPNHIAADVDPLDIRLLPGANRPWANEYPTPAARVPVMEEAIKSKIDKGLLVEVRLGTRRPDHDAVRVPSFLTPNGRLVIDLKLGIPAVTMDKLVSLSFPETIATMRSRVAVLTFYAAHAPHLMILLSPFHKLTALSGSTANACRRQGIDIDDLRDRWAEACKKFNDIEPLHAPDPECEFHIDSDASMGGMAGVLFQLDANDGRRIIGMVSRPLTAAEKTYSAGQLEMAAIVFAVRRFHRLVAHRRVHVHTDHAAICPAPGSTKMPLLQRRWAKILRHDYHLVFHFRPGVENELADGLSRQFSSDDEAETGESGTGHEQRDADEGVVRFHGDRLPPAQAAVAATETTTGPTTRNRGAAGAPPPAAPGEGSPATHRVRTNTHDPTSPASGAPDDGAPPAPSDKAGGEPAPEDSDDEDDDDDDEPDDVAHADRGTAKGQPWPPEYDGDGSIIPPLGSQRLRYIHGQRRFEPAPEHRAAVLDLCHGLFHNGRITTRARLADLGFTYPGATAAIKRMVEDCPTCAQHRARQRGTKRRSIDTYNETEVGSHWCIDVVHLPRAGGFVAALVTIDVASRFVWIDPLTNKTAAAVAGHLARRALQHGSPFRLTHDGGAENTGAIMQETAAALGIATGRSIPWCPASNGLVERAIGRIIGAMRVMGEARPDTWNVYADAVAYRVNTTVSRVHGMTPFHVYFARRPRLMIGPPVQGEQHAPSDPRSVAARVVTARTALNRALGEHAAMRTAAARRTQDAASPRETVFPTGSWVRYHDPSAHDGHADKLTGTWLGPLRVSGRTTQGSYWLEDLHQVRLSRQFAPNHLVAAAAPAAADKPLWVVQQIVGHTDTRLGRLYRTRWVGYRPADDTDEPQSSFADDVLTEQYDRRIEGERLGRRGAKRPRVAAAAETDDDIADPASAETPGTARHPAHVHIAKRGGANADAAAAGRRATAEAARGERASRRNQRH